MNETESAVRQNQTNLAKIALEEYRAKLKSGEIEKPVRLDPIERSKANPKSKTLAIKAMCYDCSGASATEASLCQVVKCPLYSFNPYIKGSKEYEEETNQE